MEFGEFVKLLYGFAKDKYDDQASFFKDLMIHSVSESKIDYFDNLTKRCH